MACYHPIAAWRDPSGHGITFNEAKGGDRCDIPCGRCLGCLERRAKEWTVRCVHESQMWPKNCFVTLTYGTGNLPPGNSLEHRDFQLFMKRTRSKFGQVRFFMCGEYGPVNQRPHYHALLFNLDFADKVPSGKSGSGQKYFKSATLDELWSLGICSVQPVNAATVGYCTRYVIDKKFGDDAEKHYACDEFIDDHGVIRLSRTPEYCASSLKPGIGARWLDKFKSDCFPRDYVVLDGVKYPVPKYYEKLIDREGDIRMDEVEFARQLRAKEAFADNTDERLQVREKVHEARVRNLKRDGI